VHREVQMLSVQQGCKALSLVSSVSSGVSEAELAYTGSLAHHRACVTYLLFPQCAHSTLNRLQPCRLT
jgi:hypothetical protein